MNIWISRSFEYEYMDIFSQNKSIDITLLKIEFTRRHGFVKWPVKYVSFLTTILARLA